LEPLMFPGPPFSPEKAPVPKILPAALWIRGPKQTGRAFFSRLGEIPRPPPFFFFIGRFPHCPFSPPFFCWSPRTLGVVSTPRGQGRAPPPACALGRRSQAIPCPGPAGKPPNKLCPDAPPIPARPLVSSTARKTKKISILFFCPFGLPFLGPVPPPFPSPPVFFPRIRPTSVAENQNPWWVKPVGLKAWYIREKKSSWNLFFLRERLLGLSTPKLAPKMAERPPRNEARPPPCFFFFCPLPTK